MFPEKAFGMFAVYSCTVCYSYLFYQIYFCLKILCCLISFDTIQSIEPPLHESPILFSKFNVLLLTLESHFFFFTKIKLLLSLSITWIIIVTQCNQNLRLKLTIWFITMWGQWTRLHCWEASKTDSPSLLLSEIFFKWRYILTRKRNRTAYAIFYLYVSP